MMSRSSRTPILLMLGALCVILTFGLVYRHMTAGIQKKRNLVAINHYSNQWVQTSEKLNEQKIVNLTMERDFATQTEELQGYSNTLTTISADLEKTQSAAKAAAEDARDQILRQDARIAQLETQRDGMTKTLSELTDSISKLETQIAETEHQLEESSADREVLMAELTRLQAEKSELEKRFNDLAMLRQQIRKVRDELSISRRLEWIRRGLYGRLKGGELLSKTVASTTTTAQNQFNLDVELRQDEAAKLISSPTP